jgi:hypothetical protein
VQDFGIADRQGEPYVDAFAPIVARLAGS